MILFRSKSKEKDTDAAETFEQRSEIVTHSLLVFAAVLNQSCTLLVGLKGKFQHLDLNNLSPAEKNLFEIVPAHDGDCLQAVLHMLTFGEEVATSFPAEYGWSGNLRTLVDETLQRVGMTSSAFLKARGTTIPAASKVMETVLLAHIESLLPQYLALPARKKGRRCDRMIKEIMRKGVDAVYELYGVDMEPYRKMLPKSFFV